MSDMSSKENRRAFYNSTKWRRLRQKVLERDHYECQWCVTEGRVISNLSQSSSRERIILEVDHIKELEYYPDLALEMDNLRTLCKFHHNQRHQRFEFKKKQVKKKRLFREDEWWG